MPLAWSAACFALLGLLTSLVTRDSSPLDAVDLWGRNAEDWADDLPFLTVLLRGIEHLFGTVGMTVITVITAALLAWKKHTRAALFTLGVMIVTALVTTAVKVSIGRVRPEWQDTIQFLESKAFPSGHTSSSTAFAGVLIVLTMMLIRRSSSRRAAVLASIAMAVVVGLDRVLLGRHYPSDVLAGSLLGAGVVLLALALFSPRPRSHAARIEPLVTSVPTTRQVAVVLNPVKVEDPGQFRSMVGQMAAEAGWSEPSWHYTTVQDPGTGMAHDAAVEGADLVIVCGGDGTVREVCAELAGTGIPVGIVPAGTGNLLARNLEIPLYLRSAIDVALTGQDRAIDLVKVSGDGFDDGHFMVMAGMGFDAAIMDGVNENFKKKVGWFAYVISGLKSLMFPAMKVEISVDGGEPTTHRARTVMVGNVGYLQAGMPLLPDAAIDDGQLDVVILHPRRFRSWIPLAARVLAKSNQTDELINRMTGASVVVRTHSDVPRQLDGDSIGPGQELRMECQPGRLLVRVAR